MKKFITATFADFEKKSSKDKYYAKSAKSHWECYREVIKIIKNLDFNSVLELGPYKIPVIKNADIMDKWPKAPRLTIFHDATQTPWPIKDKQYDLFIALQVWEHLKGKQKQAFKEVMRISKMAILSFPLNWNVPGNCHHNITEEKIAQWTLGVKPEKKIIAGNFIRKLLNQNLRIIYFFKF